jgi:hypothetical protein
MVPVLTMLILISSSCDKIQDEIDKIISVVRKSFDDSKDVRVKMEKFMLQFYGERQNFSANNFFVINKSIIHKVISN